MISTFTILFVALLTIVGIRKTVQWIRARQFSKSQGCKPPPSEGQFDLLGVLNLISLVRHHLKRTALSNTIRRFEKYGETFDSKLLAQNIYWTCNARNIKQVLTIRFADYDAAFGRAHLFRPITEHGILVLDGPKWKAARDVYRNQFSNTRSIVDLDMFEYHVQTFLRNVTTADGPINLAPLFLSLVQDITTEFVLGESADTLSPTQSIDKKRFIESLMFVKKIIARDGYLGAMHVFFSKKAYHQACNDVKRFVEPIIEKELDRQMQHRKGDVLENSATRYFMLKGMADNTDSKLELRDGTISVLLAGIDSVESLLDMTFWLLARNREVFAKLRTEVLDNIGRNRPTYDQLKNLTYLRYVFNESEARKSVNNKCSILMCYCASSFTIVSASTFECKDSEQGHYAAMWRRS
ncbi:MAG: hypothetical protein Q9190_005399 [Brigantiaea leucoxantha]